MRSKEKKTSCSGNERLVFLNQPISGIESDWIGVTSYVKKLEEAIEAGAQMIAVISDFGSGKSSLIELLGKRYQSCSKEDCHVYRVNLWSHLESCMDNSSEIHKSFLYQLVSQIDHRKSSYISKRLSKNYGLFKLTTIGKEYTFLTFLALFFVFLFIAINALSNFDSDSISHLFSEFQGKLDLLLFLLYVLTIVIVATLLVKADILFSTNKSEGKRELEESEVVDLYKNIILKPRLCKKSRIGSKHFIIVLEDLDRTENPREVLRFLKELRKYYLVDSKGLYKNSVTFIVNIRPEFDIDQYQYNPKDFNAEPPEGTADLNNVKYPKVYPKLFDYTLNLKRINIDNYDVILDGLLKERKVAIERLGLQVHDCDNIHHIQGLQWIVKGKHLDIREVKERLNAAFSLHESIVDKFGIDKIDAKMTFEKCAIVAYLTDAFPGDFSIMDDRIFQELVEQYISEKLDAEDDYKALLPDGVSNEYINEIKLLIENKHIDINYRTYFYNYPKGSTVLNAAEIKVMNAIIYQEEIYEDFEEFVNILMKDKSDVIYKALEKVKESGLRFPNCVFKSESLYTEALRFFPKELLATISVDFKYKDGEISKTLLDLKRILSFDSNRNHYNKNIAEQFCAIWEQKCSQSALLKIRKMLCQEFPWEIEWYLSLFVKPHPIIEQEELDAIDDITIAIKLIDQESEGLSVDIIGILHDKIVQAEKSDVPVEDVEAFYCDVIGIVDESLMVPFLLEYMLKMNKMIAPFEAAIMNHINGDEQYAKDYIQLVNGVAPDNLSVTTLTNLRTHQLYEGLSEDVRNQQLQQGFYLDYIYSMYYSDIDQIDFRDEYIKDTMADNSEEIFNDYPNIWLSMRTRILEAYQEMIGYYGFMFSSPYPLITEQELNCVNDVKDAIDLIEPSNVDEDNLEIIANYLNQKYRVLSETYLILQFVASLNDGLSRTLFYMLDMQQIQYKRIARGKKLHLKELFKDKLNLTTAQGAIDFMEHAGELDSGLERVVKQVVNVEKNIQKSYADLVIKIDKPTPSTLPTIRQMGTIYAYGENIRGELYKNKDYKIYISSTILSRGIFEFEEEKVSALWPEYINILKLENGYETTKSKMLENQDFLYRIMERKEYVGLPESSRLMLANIYQSFDCLEDILSYGNEFSEKYYLQIAGFESKRAAEKFIEIMSANPELLKSQEIYDHTYPLLVDPSLKSKYTRMRNKQNSQLDI